MAYVYEHWRPDLNQPFWVGKGTGSRRYLFKRRGNKHYNAVVQKLESAGLRAEVKIIADGLDDAAAFRIEIERIEFWQKEGVCLTNQSTGGRGGMSGCKRSEESRAKQSATTTGRKLSKEHREKTLQMVRSPEMRAFISAVHTGRKRPKETSLKIGAAQKRSWANPETRARRLAALKPPTVTEESRAKMRAAKTPEVRARISAAAKKQWENPEFRKLVSDTMARTNAARRSNHLCAN